MKFLSQSKTLLAALAFAACAGAAQADVIQIKTNVAGGITYTDLVSTKGTGGYNGVASLWNVQNQTTGDSFLAYCIELAEKADQTQVRTYTSSTYNPSADVQELYDRFYGTVLTNASQAVGFQLALWELLGFVDASNMVAPLTSAITVAEAMLTAVAGNTGYTAGQYTYTRWTSIGYQDVLQVTPVTNAVPEPHTSALLLSGLGLMGMGAMSRRKGKQGK